MTIDNQSVRIRMAAIDAPEKGQAGGRRSEQSLRELVWKKDVAATWQRRDQYGRPLAQIVVGNLNANAEPVERGMAWVYRQYSNDPKLIAAEQQARLEKRGLWTDTNPIPPWEWRRANPTKH